MDNDDIKIIRATGVANRLTLEEQKEEVEKNYKNIQLELKEEQKFYVTDLKFDEASVTVSFIYNNEKGLISYEIDMEKEKVFVTDTKGVALKLNEEVFELIFELVTKYISMQATKALNKESIKIEEFSKVCDFNSNNEVALEDFIIQVVECSTDIITVSFIYKEESGTLSFRLYLDSDELNIFNITGSANDLNKEDFIAIYKLTCNIKKETQNSTRTRKR